VAFKFTPIEPLDYHVCHLSLAPSKPKIIYEVREILHV